MQIEIKKVLPEANGEQKLHNNEFVPVNIKSEVSILHLKAHEFLVKKREKIGLPQNAILPYPDVKLILSSMMHLSKDESFKVVKELSQLNLIEVVGHHGIKIVKVQGKNER